MKIKRYHHHDARVVKTKTKLYRHKMFYHLYIDISSHFISFIFWRSPFLSSHWLVLCVHDFIIWYLIWPWKIFFKRREFHCICVSCFYTTLIEYLEHHQLVLFFLENFSFFNLHLSHCRKQLKTFKGFRFHKSIKS